MVGLATGDALGTTLEFSIPGSFKPIKEIEGGGPFSLQPGEWTDDTSMALCLAESLIEKKGLTRLTSFNDIPSGIKKVTSVAMEYVLI